jgi:hypothetical protein
MQASLRLALAKVLDFANEVLLNCFDVFNHFLDYHCFGERLVDSFVMDSFRSAV